MRAVLAAVALCCVVSGCTSSDTTPGTGVVTGPGAEADAARGTVVTTVRPPGAATGAGGCGPELRNASAPARHVAPGTTMSYAGVPPVSGAHWAQWPEIVKGLYVVEERPELGELVHSQEHGWTLVWYDDTVAADEEAMTAARNAAEQVAASGAVKVVFVPWTTDDGAAFPAGQHVAITHWGSSRGGTEYRQFCSTVDAGAVLAFVERHPYTDSYEPNGP